MSVPATTERNADTDRIEVERVMDTDNESASKDLKNRA